MEGWTGELLSLLMASIETDEAKKGWLVHVVARDTFVRSVCIIKPAPHTRCYQLAIASGSSLLPIVLVPLGSLERATDGGGGLWHLILY